MVDKNTVITKQFATETQRHRDFCGGFFSKKGFYYSYGSVLFSLKLDEIYF